MGQAASCVVVDLDGTLADVGHRRRFIKGGKRDWKAFHEACIHDKPNGWCVRLILALRAAGYEIHLVSGRSHAVERLTLRWLARVFKGDLSGLHLDLLRPHGRLTKDTDLKREWLRRFGKDKVLFAVDDRKRIVDMWREEGVVCLQCDDWEEREQAAALALRVRAVEDRGDARPRAGALSGARAEGSPSRPAGGRPSCRPPARRRAPG